MVKLFIVAQPPFYKDNEKAAQMLTQAGKEVKCIGLSAGVAEWVRMPFIRDEKGFAHFGLESITDFVS